MSTKGVFAVVGMPYSGSTLLSFIVGSNEQVFNGADLHHLNASKRGVCSLHKGRCEVLNEEERERIYNSFESCDDWYDNISKATGKDFIFDASKQLEFFKRVLPETNKPLVIIALNKHPMRAMCSDLYNRFFARQKNIEDLSEIKRYIKDNEAEVRQFLSHRLMALKRDVEGRARLLKEIEGRENIVSIIPVLYEEYIKNPDKTASQLLSCFGLSYDPGFKNYMNYEHHPITGNMAPLWKVKHSGKSEVISGGYRKKFYLEQQGAIVIDNKYLEIFDEDMIKWIECQGVYLSLLKDLGYKKLTQNGFFEKFKNIFQVRD